MSRTGLDFTTDRLADAFLSYLLERFRGTRHVRRVAAWLGLIALGVDKVADRRWISHSRQLVFERHDGDRLRRYKVRYRHLLGARGGIEISLQLDHGRNGRWVDGPSLYTIENLVDAARFCRSPARCLDPIK